ncbi:SgcJ/EcaC family oxidoreductase [Salipiger sp. P9]|uniref:SgcJ/EcaC family oxidoreductase n=1 Tax=Salipiger pentaromativorans TaxID=2943193 RepID=UPI002158206B|nr:SgcJ/EcaC family oxidoreductase [Salipiger pentaromativorans]MCR8547626.1 SgcJ/EcaC family oxidoreductase [Salipiger pentaromativorans]
MASPTPTEPEAFPAAFARAWATREGTEIAALFTEDADFVNVTGLWWTGRDRIAAPHDYALKSFFAGTELRPGRIAVRRLGDDIALVRCRFTLTGQRLPDGAAAGPRQTILLFVLQRGPTGWRAVTAQNTDVVPGMETHANDGTLRAVDYRTP